MTLGTGVLGTGVLGSSEVDKVVRAVKASEELPPFAKELIEGFLLKTFGDLWNRIEDLANIETPEDLADFWDVFLVIIKNM